MRATCGCLVEDGMVLHAFDGPCAIPRPTAEDYCAGYDHVYVGDDGGLDEEGVVGRCYCGQRTYPAGGPDNGSEDNPHESDGTAPEACSYCGDVWPCASGVPTCTGDPCTCSNGIGCVNIPVDQW